MAVSYQPLIYRAQGSTKFVVASGGEIEIQSGGTLDIQAGSTVDFAGVLTFPTGAKVALETGSTLDVEDGAVVTFASGAVVTAESGSTLNLAGIVMVESGGILTAESGGKVLLASGSTFDVASGAIVTLASGSTVEVESGGAINYASGGVGKIGSTAAIPDANGYIYGVAGFREKVASGSTVTALVVGVQTLDCSTNGVYTLPVAAAGMQGAMIHCIKTNATTTVTAIVQEPTTLVFMSGVYRQVTLAAQHETISFILPSTASNRWAVLNATLVSTAAFVTT